MHFTGPSIVLLALAAHVGVLAAPAQERSLLSLDTREATENVPRQVFNPKTDTGILPREVLNPRGNEDSNGNGKLNNGNNDSKGKKNNNGNNNDSVAIQIKINEQKKKKEEIIVVRIIEVIRKNKKNDKKKDNLRKEAYKNKNKNKNTTIIVVTVIVEIRNNNGKNGKNGNNNQNDKNNKNDNNGKKDNNGKSSKGNHGGNKTWYAKHTLRVNNGAKEEQTVQVTDYQTTYLAQNTGSSGAAASDASAVSGLAAMQTIDPNAPFQMNNGTELAPQASGAPTWPVVQPDPARAAVTGA